MTETLTPELRAILSKTGGADVQTLLSALSTAEARIEELERERDDWRQAGDRIADKCREEHGPHFRLVGGRMGDGTGAVPAVPFHEEPICEARLTIANKVVEETARTPHAHRYIAADGEWAISVKMEHESPSCDLCAALAAYRASGQKEK